MTLRQKALKFITLYTNGKLINRCLENINKLIEIKYLLKKLEYYPSRM